MRDVRVGRHMVRRVRFSIDYIDKSTTDEQPRVGWTAEVTVG